MNEKLLTIDVFISFRKASGDESEVYYDWLAQNKS